MIFSRRGANGVRDLEELIEVMQAEVVAHDHALAQFSKIETFKRYGKGIHPDARLNFCDCAAYALAKTLNCAIAVQGQQTSRKPTWSAPDFRRPAQAASPRRACGTSWAANELPSVLRSTNPKLGAVSGRPPAAILRRRQTRRLAPPRAE